MDYAYSLNGQTIEGRVYIKFYLNGEDFTESYTKYCKNNLNKTIKTDFYCTSFRAIKNSDAYYVGVKYIPQQQTYPQNPSTATSNITFPLFEDLTFASITPGTSANPTWSTDEKCFLINGAKWTDDTIRVYFKSETISAQGYSVKVQASSHSEYCDLNIDPKKDSYNFNDTVTIKCKGVTNGYSFNLWTIDMEGYPSETKMGDVSDDFSYTFSVVANTTCTANIKPSEYLVKCVMGNSQTTLTDLYHFYATFNESFPDIQSFDQSDILDKIPVGYTFEGFYDNINFNGTPFYDKNFTNAGKICNYTNFPNLDSINTNNPIYLYAKLTTNKYTIKYNLNGGTGEMTPTTYTVETATFNLPTPTKQNYSFVGWYKNDKFTGSRISQITKGTTGNQEYWAKWYEDNGRIATNEYIYNLCAYSNTSAYQLSTSGDYVEDKCPTRSHILSNYGGQLINIPGSYSYDQCIKESDLSLKSRTINFIIRNSTGSPMNETTISMYENGGSTKTHSVTWPSTNNENSGDVSNSYTINSDNFSKFGSSLKFKWDANYIVRKRLQCQFNNGFLSKTIKLNGNDSLTLLGGSVDFEIEEKLEFFIKISNSTANIIFIITQE